jgi:hypothetical protein
MKATLKFDLLNPDEQQSHLRCILSTKMAFVLWEMNSNCYKKLENDGDSAYNQGVLDALEMMRDLMEEDGIYINDLID